MKLAMEEELLNYEWSKDGDPPSVFGNRNRDNPNAWSDKNKNAEQFDYDPDTAVDEWWASESNGFQMDQSLESVEVDSNFQAR